MVPVVTLPPVTPFTCQVTTVLLDPETVAVNVCLPNVLKVALAGCKLTVTLPFLTVPAGTLLHAARIGTIEAQSKKTCSRRMDTPSIHCIFQTSTGHFGAGVTTY